MKTEKTSFFWKMKDFNQRSAAEETNLSVTLIMIDCLNKLDHFNRSSMRRKNWMSNLKAKLRSTSMKFKNLKSNPRKPSEMTLKNSTQKLKLKMSICITRSKNMKKRSKPWNLRATKTCLSQVLMRRLASRTLSWETKCEICSKREINISQSWRMLRKNLLILNWKNRH